MAGQQLDATCRAARQRRSRAFHPIYIPYWTFDATALAAWNAQVGHVVSHVYTDREGFTRREANTSNGANEAGQGRKSLQRPSGAGNDAPELERHWARSMLIIFSDLVLYEPRFLAGMLAQSYDLPLDEAWDAGPHMFYASARVRPAWTTQARIAYAISVCRWTFVMSSGGISWYRYIPVFTAIKIKPTRSC